MTALDVVGRPDPAAGSERSVEPIGRRAAGPSRPAAAPGPLSLNHRVEVGDALRILAAYRQGLAFVEADGGRAGVVTAEDLRFTAEWAGPAATVAHAVTQALVDLAADEGVHPCGWGPEARPGCVAAPAPDRAARLAGRRPVHPGHIHPQLTPTEEP